MQSRSLLTLGLVVAVLAPAAATAQQQQKDTRPGIAVLPFAYGGSFGPNKEDMEPLTIGLQQMLLTELAQNSAMRVVDRSVIKNLLEEQNLGASGRVDPETAARIGKLVGARYVVTGVFTDLFGDFRMDGRVIDVETSEVLKAEEVRDKREKLYDLLVELADKITHDVKLPPLPQQVQAARKARDISPEAITLYSRAQFYQDRGQKDRAIELYRRIVKDFPKMTEAQEALQQLNAGS